MQSTENGVAGRFDLEQPAAWAGGGLPTRSGPGGIKHKLLARKQKQPAGDGARTGKPAKAKRQHKWSKKKIISISVITCCALAGGYFLYQLFFVEEEAVALTGTTTYGSLNRAISGSGTTQPLETQTVSLASADAEILNVYVQVGDEVEVGDPLYEQDDAEIDDLILEYETEINELKIELNDYYEQLAEAQEDQSNLTVVAPFSGRISEITVRAEDEIAKGSKLAAITDDSAMLLTQYVSYAYQDLVSAGITAYVSIAEQMLLLTGTVTDIEWTNYISADGTRCFTVEIEIPNPGSLSEGMTAASYFIYNGMEIYPVQSGELAYGNYKLLSAEANGTVSRVNVADYQQVSKGQTLFMLESDTYEKQIQTLQSSIENAEKQIEDYQEKIEEAEEDRADYIVTAEIAGKVMGVNIEPGMPNMFMMNQTAVTIYNLDVMTITVNIDELDVDYLSEGLTVEVTRTSAEVTTPYEAEISNISFEASSDSGVSTFPVTIEINSAGALSAGVSVSYSVSVGDTEESVLAPVEAVKSTSEGNCLFVKADQRPDNAVTLSGEDDPEVPKGFYAVPVELGSSNSIYVRILSGVEADVEVFTRYQQSAPAGSDSTSEDLSGDEEEQVYPGMPGDGTMPDRSNMQNGGAMPSRQ